MSTRILITAELTPTGIINAALSDSGFSADLVDSEGNRIVDSDGEQLFARSPALDVQGDILARGTLGGTITLPEVVSATPYAGEYVVTPSAEVQTLETVNRRMTENVIIQPVPNNYGLITWDGSVLTVS